MQRILTSLLLALAGVLAPPLASARMLTLPDGFGNVAFGSAADGHYSTLGYRGQLHDPTGLTFLRNRYYDPNVGRFTQQDPIRSGTDWYAYPQDPVNNWDPMGLEVRTLVRNGITYLVNYRDDGSVMGVVRAQDNFNSSSGVAWSRGSGISLPDAYADATYGVVGGIQGATVGAGSQITLLAYDLAKGDGEDYESAWGQEVYARTRAGEQVSKIEVAKALSGYSLGEQYGASVQRGVQTGDWSQFSASSGAMGTVLFTLGGAAKGGPRAVAAEQPVNPGFVAQGLASRALSAGGSRLADLPVGAVIEAMPSVGAKTSGRWIKTAEGFEPLSQVAAENVVYRELSVADRAALEAGQPLMPKGSGGTILGHVRGESTGHISASETISGTARFNNGNGLAAIDVDAATAGGTKLIPHQQVIDAVAPRLKQIQKVQEAREVLFDGPIPANAVRIIRGN